MIYLNFYCLIAPYQSTNGLGTMTISGAHTLDDILRRNDTNFTTNTDKTFTLEVGLPSGKKNLY